MRSAFSLKIGYYGLTAQLGEGRGERGGEMEGGRGNLECGSGKVEGGIRKGEGGRWEGGKL